MARGSSISMAIVADFLRSKAHEAWFNSRRLAAELMVSMVMSNVRGVASLGVEAWLVSVS